MEPQTVLVDYHQLVLSPSGADFEFSPDGDSDAVVTVTHDGTGITISTGITSGPVLLSVRKTLPDDTTWAHRHDAEMTIREPLCVCSPTVLDPGPDGPVFEPRTPGRHRVTVFETGRAAVADTFEDPEGQPTEKYLVVFESQPD